MVDIRHQIHGHPELGLEEYATSRLIQDRLEALGIPTLTGLAGTGVVGILEGRGPGRTLLLRADMDALPIQEEAEVPYRSRIPGRMHACGHDGHVAGLLGAAMILNEMRSEFTGTVKFAFQPAEETGGGALKMIQAGVLENPKVDAALGCHLWGLLASGQVGVRPGPLMAASCSFRMVIQGKGGHGGQPHLAVDPIPIGAEVVSALQTIISRHADPLEPAVLTLGSIRSGSAGNVIPETLEAQGTVRAFHPEACQSIMGRIEAVLQGICQAHGALGRLEATGLFPALVNDPAMAALAAGAFARIVGPENVLSDVAPTMSNEDFAYFCQSVPSAFVFVGIAGADGVPVCHHHPRFQWDDRHLRTVSRGLAQMAMEYLAAPSA